MLPDISHVPGLTSQRFEQARRAAQESIRQSVPKPVEQTYHRAGSGIPQGVVYAAIAMLLIVAFAAFVISAQKQIVATADILYKMAAEHDQLTPFLAGAGVIAGLALGELGTILFSIAASVLRGEPYTVRRVTFYPTALIFRLFSVGCALFAILANASIHTGEGAFAVYFTYIPPITVIAIGLVVEALVMDTVKTRASQRQRFLAAFAEWELYQNEPERHKTFKSVWARAIYDELGRFKKDRVLIDPLVEKDKQVMALLVQREYQTHMVWEAFSLDVPATPRPISPLPESQPGEGQTEQPSLLQSNVAPTPYSNGLPIPLSDV